MSVRFTVYDQAGRIVSRKKVPRMADLYETMSALPDHRWAMGHWDPEAYYIDLDSGRATLRPIAPDPDGAEYDMCDLPPGARLIVTDPYGNTTEVDARPEDLTLAGKGAWRLQSQCPFPWVDFDKIVVVE